MSSLHPRNLRKAPAFKSVQYILRQAREYLVRDINAVLKRVVPGTTEDTDPVFYKMLKLTFFAHGPYQAAPECSAVINKCLAHDNSEAHYIEGILQGFYWDKLDDGLLHLRKSGDGMYAPGILLYGILMLCLGNMDEGKIYLDKLECKIHKNRVARPWSTVKKSLRRLEPLESCMPC
ncbi:hypothetical protein N665_0151s0038 [Sinapis alba]|nr:hypothetical protein N665_0151s0038 [Sinapis alba]